MIETGTRIGTYEILGILGSGGMGEVYLALDTKLGREVAIKCLSDQFKFEEERLVRFRREAKLLASLRHPNIAVIHGIEEDDNCIFLILELIDGKTLEEWMALGPLPTKEILTIALQIAKALEAAHDKGIVHRDLKPGNVKITSDENIKLLDFGLAKISDHEPTAKDRSHSPTVSLSHLMTDSGMILGTIHYMSPEQARGKQVDRRADIWAFGVILFEMLSGKKPFSGETTSDTLANILRAEPDWSLLPKNTPMFLQKLLKRCLEPDPSRRLRDIGEARIAIEDHSSGTSESESLPMDVGRSRLHRLVPWTLVALFGLFGFFSLWHLQQNHPNFSKENRFVALTATLPNKVSLTSGQWPVLAFSPDGKMLAYIGTTPDNTQIFLRRIDRLESSPLSGTEGSIDLFFSPDSQWLGFFANAKLMKIPVQGGTPVELCEARDSRGGTWTAQDRIIFTPSFATGLMSISTDGGKPKLLTNPDTAKGERTHRWPHALPNEKMILFTVGSWKSPSDYDDSEIVAFSPESGKKKVVTRGRMARYTTSGHLIYLKGSTLFGGPFSLKNLEFTKQPVPLLEGVDGEASSGAGNFDISSDGSLAYVPRGASYKSSLVFADRKGKINPLPLAPGSYRFPRFSPDGNRIAFCIGSGKSGEFDVWTFDLRNHVLNRLTFNSSSYSPLWTPDGKRIAFTSTSGMGVYWKPADGSGKEELLFNKPFLAGSWTPDGKKLACTAAVQDVDLYLVSMDGDRNPQPFLNTEHGECCPSFSPDGRFIAYNSSETGRSEVFVSTFPDPSGGKWQISNEGGFMPIWSRNGSEIFYTKVTRMYVVDVTLQPSFKASEPRLLLEGPYEFRTVADLNYDVAPDGQTILAVQQSGLSEMKQINVILNWFDQLDRLTANN